MIIEGMITKMTIGRMIAKMTTGWTIFRMTTEEIFDTDTSVITHLVIIETTNDHITTLEDRLMIQDTKTTAGITTIIEAKIIHWLLVVSKIVKKWEMTVGDLGWHESSYTNLKFRMNQGDKISDHHKPN